MIPTMSRLFILVYLLCATLQTTLQQPVAMAEAEKDRPIPAIYGTPPEPAVKVLREARPITERESLQASDDMQQSESYTYRYYRPLYYPGVYYSYYPRYRWYRPYYYYDWWYY
ncbi:uncharacterized protein LOC131205220 [Anopheles bellator]|uniref:uncharacterized protein LOC131205220 n=1 Tax=Anopheles bellator TaxID=139047 RepID=UPI002649F69A|nr:uncharacterized protein LOC131205220 [Anopheles bellator]